MTGVQTCALPIYGMEVESLPVVGLSRNLPRFAASFWSSLGQCRKLFRENRPDAVLAMGGFTAAASIRVGCQIKIPTFLHESNVVPGRANRFLSRWVDEIFIGFDAARKRFGQKKITESGTPVRSEFRNQNRDECCVRLGFDAAKPLILVTGGSQGARGVNRMVTGALPRLTDYLPDTQWLHLCGPHDLAEVKKAYGITCLRSAIHSFFHDMPSALGAADLVISRSGASSLAELAAAKVPAILVPLPTAADDHQRANARAAATNGGAIVLEIGRASCRERV